MTIVSIAERLGQDEFLARSLHRDYRHVTQAVDAPVPSSPSTSSTN
jgi:hypothetical protein